MRTKQTKLRMYSSHGLRRKRTMREKIQITVRKKGK